MYQKRRGFIQALIAGLIAFGVFSGANAGPNAGGVLVAHDTGLLASGTSSGTTVCALGDIPAGLAEVDARIDGAHNPDDMAIFKIYAVFPVGNSPRLAGLTFGIRYNSAELALEAAAGRHCGDFELVGSGWPGPNQDCSVTWDQVQSGLVTPVYWFAGYQMESGGQYPATRFEVTPHSTQGGYFGDDSVPASLDAIGGYGRLGFDTEGYVPPEGGVPGACCDPATDICLVRSAADCGEDGVFKGPDVPCDPNPCPVFGGCCHPDDSCENNVTRLACEQAGYHFQPLGCAAGGTCSFYPMGACCRDGGTTCTMTTEANCADGLWREGRECGTEPPPCDPTMGACCISNTCWVIPETDCDLGVFHLATDCSPDPCVVPVQRMSWGKLKSLYGK